MSGSSSKIVVEGVGVTTTMVVMVVVMFGTSLTVDMGMFVGTKSAASPASSTRTASTPKVGRRHGYVCRTEVGRERWDVEGRVDASVHEVGNERR